ncbi:MAG: HEAT repeat domain-containing protein [Candidatus Aminicenantes bacterium]|jgi:HEAT repeat protein
MKRKKMDIQKTKRLMIAVAILGLISWISFPSLTGSPAPSSMKALIVTGQNNHDWKTSTSVLKQILENTGLFEVEVATSPPQGGNMDGFNPNFSSYQLVVLDYNGDDWPPATQKAFVDYVRTGGGVVFYHAADNAFTQWKEYNEISGLGGWGNRNEKAGPYIYWKDGKMVRDTSAGIGGYHGYQHDFLVINRDTTHPITRGLPQKWMHVKDELYSLMRGPGKNMHILATAYSSPLQNGTGRDEPVLFTVSYGKGRIFHTVLGHAGGEIPPPSMECVGFIVTLQRGAEWAASGKVTQKIPGDFPAVYRDTSTPDDVRRWKNFRPPSLINILEKVSTYDYGEDEEILSQLRDYIRSHRHSSESRKQCEELLAEFLDSNATLAAKMTVCRHLREIGTSLSVPVLERMLLKEETSDMARYALEKIPGASADRALIQGLSQSDKKIKIGIISSLGQRNAPDSVPALEKLLSDSDSSTAISAAVALGNIATPEASTALSKAMGKTSGELQSKIASSLLKCIEQFLTRGNRKSAIKLTNKILSTQLPLPIHQSALKSKIAASGNEAGKMIIDILKGKEQPFYLPAISMVRDVFDSSTIQEVCKTLPDLPEDSQVQLLEVLAHYPEKKVLDSVVKATKNEEKMVRMAALKALESIGDSSTVELLARHAAGTQGEEQRTARNSLWRLDGEGVDQTILVSLIKLTDPGIQEELIMSVGERRILDGINFLFSRARSSRPAIRLAAIKALEEVAAPSDLPRLLQLLLSARGEREQTELENTIAGVAGKRPNPIGRANSVKAMLPEVEDIQKRAALLRVLGKIGDDSSLSLVRQALADDNPEIRDAAVRALSDWPTLSPKEDLVRIVQTSQEQVHQVLALRAYVRMIEMEPYRSPENAVRSLKETLTWTKRPEEKKLILGILPQFACPDALKLAESLLKEKGVEEEAREAVKQIQRRLKRQ